MSEYYPPPAFFFNVTILGSLTPMALLTDIDASFQEISGIKAEFGTDPVVEGGENRFIHQLPKQTKYSNLVLKRGAVTKLSTIAEWTSATIGSSLSIPIIPQNILVTLQNENNNPVIAWAFINAYPIKWDISPMNSQENKILTESLEFSYNYFERINLGSAAAAAVKIAQLTAKLVM